MIYVFVKTPKGKKQCMVIEFTKNEKNNSAVLRVKGIVESNFVTTRIEINDLKSFEEYKEVSSAHGYYKLLKPVHHGGNDEHPQKSQASS